MSAAPPQQQDDQEATLAKAAYCTDVSHFYTPHARDLIGRLLRTFLDNLKLTPTEILYSLTCQRKLMTSGNVLEAAVQRAALAQVKDTEVRATQRIKELHGLVEYVTKRVRGEGRGYALDEITRDDAIKQIRQLLPTPDSAAKDFRVYSLASKWLEECPSWVEKYKRLLTMFEAIAKEGKNAPHNLAFGDVLLGEMLRSKAGLDTIIGDFDNLEQRLIDIAGLYRGEIIRRDAVPDGALSDRVAKLYSSLKLPSSRAGLAYHVYSALSGRTSIVARDVVLELSAIARLVGALRHESGFIGGIKTFDLIERRIMRTLSVENLGEKLRQLPEKVDQVRTLVVVHDVLIGQQNKRLVRNYLEYVMEDRQFPIKLFSGHADDQGDLVKRPAALHKLFSESGLSDMQREKYIKLCQDLQNAYIAKENFFGRIDREIKDSAMKALYLMRLCGESAFIPGEHLDAARKLVGHYIMQPDFLPSYLVDAETNEDRRRKVDNLKRFLLAAGIDETFLGK